MATLLDQWRLIGRILADKRLAKGDAAVAWALLDFATDEGGAWPSIDNLAVRAGYSRRTAIYSADRLVEAGYFTCKPGGGRKNTTVYWPVYETETVQPAAPFEAGNSAEDCTLSPPETVQHFAPFQAETVQSSAETVQSSVKKQCNPLHPNPPMNPPTNPPKSDSHTGEAIEAWNAMAAEIGLSKVQAVTELRRKSLAARLKDCGGMDGWTAALAKVRASEFLQGKTGGGWRISFDWLVAPRNFVKVIEGNYDRQAVATRSPQGSRGGSLAEAMALHAGLIDQAERGADE